MTDYKLPLKRIMAAIDKKDKNFFNKLNDEERKELKSKLWMMMRYGSSAQGAVAAHYIYMINELVNRDFTVFTKHPEFQWMLLATCGSGRFEFHPYIKPPNSLKRRDKVTDFVLQLYPHMKSDDIELFLKLNSKEDLKQLARDYDYDDKQIKDIFGK